MANFPYFSDLDGYITDEFVKRKHNTQYISSFVPWIRLVSGADNGLIIESNPDFSLTGDTTSMYGNSSRSGTVGIDWGGRPVYADTAKDVAYRTRPTISNLTVDEAAGGISRKAEFTITAYTTGQLDTICKYFLEPGFGVFIEWGWNTSDGTSGIVDINDNYAKTISTFTTHESLVAKRKKTKGHYDNYLGFIIGGSISANGMFWDVNVKCSGYTDLPAFLNVSNTTQTTESPDTNTLNASREQDFSQSDINAQTDFGKKFFMLMFNDLPENRKITSVKNLMDGKINSNIGDTGALIFNKVSWQGNYINFDEDIRSEINSNSNGSGFWIFSKEAKLAGVELPVGTEIVDDNRFVRAELLFKILNDVQFPKIKLGDTNVNMSIDISETRISAFENIFSMDKTKLFIPNPNTPNFANAIKSTDELKRDSVSDCSIGTITFPQQMDETKNKSNIFSAHTWGYLKDLYINLQFFNDIIKTPNLSLKDAVYQILNGVSSAVNGIWDFQITDASKSNQLSVIEMNLLSNSDNTIYEFDINGSDSIFMEASLDLDISGAKRNQIIASKLNAGANVSQPYIGLFSNYTDKLLSSDTSNTNKKTIKAADTSKPISLQSPTKAQSNTKAITANLWNKVNFTMNSSVTPTSTTTQQPTTTYAYDTQYAASLRAPADEMIRNEAQSEKSAEQVKKYLGKIGVYPKFKIQKADIGRDSWSNCLYFDCFDDPIVFDGFKYAYDLHSRDSAMVSALMPIDFTFKVHGVSGIIRGNRFKVNGLPSKYSTDGFFQVLSITHTISDNQWVTEVKGGWRRNTKSPVR
jgi:hypothetical protein